MKQEEDFDCVQMKWDIQQELLDLEFGLFGVS